MNLNIETPVMGLEQMAQVISLESNFIDNALFRINEFLPKLGNRLKDTVDSFATDSFGSYDGPKITAVQTQRDFKVISKRVYSHNFLDFQDVLVQVPEGFEGNILDYLKLLNRIHLDIFKEALEVIGDYNVVLSSFITNKEDKNSLRVHSQIYERADAKREQVLKDLSGFFKDGSDLSRLPLRKVVSRFADLELVAEEAVTLTKDNHIKNLEKVKSGITETLIYLDKITSNKEITQVSGSSAKQLAESAMSVARLVEACSVYAYKVRQAIESNRAIVDTLDKVTK
jgi:hypothetical protein